MCNQNSKTTNQTQCCKVFELIKKHLCCDKRSIFIALIAGFVILFLLALNFKTFTTTENLFSETQNTDKKKLEIYNLPSSEKQNPLSKTFKDYSPSFYLKLMVILFYIVAFVSTLIFISSLISGRRDHFYNLMKLAYDNEAEKRRSSQGKS